VTGGASGIGLAIVRRLAVGGASVALLDLDEAAADQAAAGLRGEEMIKQMVARSPVRRLGVPEDIAAAAAFLCSDDAGYITGQVIGVNGGNYT
jgi:2-hydroxycyclohexanecarboxyl-CoA dehydrogenase